MKAYTKIYLEAFGYDTYDNNSYVPSEISEDKAVDIHHIIGRGKRGKDRIENLMALTRQEHNDYGDKVIYMVYLLEIHRKRLILANIDFDNDWFERKIKAYE